jgi:hypothetical protein
MDNDTQTPTNPHTLTPDDMRELEREAAETQTPLIQLAFFGRGPLEAGRAILALLDSVGFGCTILALLGFHFRREGGVNAAVEAVARWGLTARSSVGSLLPILDAVKDPAGSSTDRRILELVARGVIRDAVHEAYDGPDVVKRLEVTGEIVEQMDIAIVTARRWWEARQVPPTSGPTSPSTAPRAPEAA